MNDLKSDVSGGDGNMWPHKIVSDPGNYLFPHRQDFFISDLFKGKFPFPTHKNQ